MALKLQWRLNYSKYETHWVLSSAAQCQMEDTESWSELSAQELIEKKDTIEAEIKAQNDILERVSRKRDIICFSLRFKLMVFCM